MSNIGSVFLPVPATLNAEANPSAYVRNTTSVLETVYHLIPPVRVTTHDLESVCLRFSDTRVTQHVLEVIAFGITPLELTCPPDSSAELGTPYDSSFGVTGGTSPFTFALVSGAFPTGLTLNTSTGELSGTPLVFGTFVFTVSVHDSGRQVATVTCSIQVDRGTACGVQTSDVAESFGTATPAAPAPVDPDAGGGTIPGSDHSDADGSGTVI